MASRKVTLKALSLMVGLVFLGTAMSARADQLSDLVARARAARGPGLGKVQGLHLSGTVEEAGVSATFDKWVDLTTGAYSESIEGGPLTGAEGFDGRTLWIKDAKGIVFPQNGSIASVQISNTRFDLTDAFFRNGYGGATVTYLGTRQDHVKSYEAISFKVAETQKSEDEWWFDSGSAALARKVVIVGGGTTTTDLSDYRSVSGLLIAYKTETSTDAGSRTVEQITGAEADPPGLAQHLLLPGSSSNDFSPAGGEISVPIDIIDHHIYLDVKLNGKGPFHFIFDTGGRNMIDPTVAYAVGARPSGSLRGGGIGRHASEIQFSTVDEVAVGGAKLSNQPFLIRELGPRTNYGLFGTTPKREMQGIIGYELPARFIVALDFASRKIKLSSPGESPASSTGADIPIAFYQTWPTLECRLSGFSGTCLLDTGSFAILLTKPFIDANPAVLPKWFTGGAFIPIMPMEGVVASGFGGLSKGQVGTLASAQFGSQALNGVEKTIFSSDEKGVLANPYLAAVVGNPVWEHFIMTLDYPHRRLRLEPAGK